MGRFIARRLIGMVFVLFAVSVVVFLVFNVIPSSDPAANIAGKNRTPELVRQVRIEFGLDKSLPEQYVVMMKKIFTGDLVSYNSRLNVDEQIRKGIPATFSLCIGAAVIWMAFGILFGYLSAVKAGRFADRALTILALVGISLPVFWLAAILLYYLTFKVQLFPNGQYVKFTDNPAQWANHLILPWITLAVVYAGFYSRVLRSNMLDAMDEDYVRAAKAKGLERAPGADPPRTSQLADPDRHPVRARFRRGDRRQHDHRRVDLQHQRRRALRRRCDQQSRPAADHGADHVRRLLHRPLQHPR